MNSWMTKGLLGKLEHCTSLSIHHLQNGAIMLDCISGMRRRITHTHTHTHTFCYRREGGRIGHRRDAELEVKRRVSVSVMFNCMTSGSSVQFSHSVLSDSLRPHRLKHTRLPCPSSTPRACSNSCALSQ